MANGKDGRTRMGGRMDDDGKAWDTQEMIDKVMADKPTGFLRRNFKGLNKLSTAYAAESVKIRDLERSERKQDRVEAQMRRDRRKYRGED